MRSSGLSRRDFVRSGALSLAAVAATEGVSLAQDTPAAQPVGPASRPNILLVLSDDHSAPHVGCYDSPDIRTPHLDAFAAQGMRFDAAYVASPQCVPSRAAIMTGQGPVRIGMTRFSAPLPMDVRTFPEYLRAAGYYTGVAGRSYHLDGSGNKPPESERVFQQYRLRTFERRLDYVKQGGRLQMVPQLTEFLDQAQGAGKPFFLQLCSGDPHRPWDDNITLARHDPATVRLPGHYPDTPAIRADFARYYDEIARFDADFGEILKVLDDRGLSQNTLVVFMGDNGASQFRGKGTLYEFGIHVPLLMRWPGVVAEGSSSAALISGEDLAPTFLEATGLTVPEEMTGRSFLKLLRGESDFQPRECIFAERGAHGSGLPGNSAAFDLARCVRTRTHKLIYNALFQLPYSPVDFGGNDFWKELQRMNAEGRLSPELSRIYFQPQRPMFELYDLVNDPWEMNNLAGNPQAKEIEHQLKAMLQEWMILQRDYLPLPIAP